MKRKALAMVLALCMILSMLPMTAFAAQPQSARSGMMTPAAVGELAPASVAPNAKSYSVTLTGSGSGAVELLVDSPAEAGSEVYFMANPDDGYLAEIYYTGLEDGELLYLGADVFGFIMPANKVTLEVSFVVAEGEEHSISVHDNGATASGQYALERSSAKQYESVLLGVYAYGSSDFKPEELVWAYGADVYYLFEQDDVHYYEIFMGDEDVNIFLTYSYLHSFKVSIRPLSIYNGTVRTDVTNASTGTEVLVYATPDPGYRLEELRVTTEGRGFAFDVNYVGEEDGVQVYSFLMPPCAVMIDADFVANINPISVTVETGLGGTASANVTEAKVGDPITLTCVPEEGYRVARITGVEDLTDNGDNTYTFPMPGEAVNVKVLFLRHENPFLDINETQFFYDSVLWAVEQKITEGMTPNTFAPFSNCNRAQVVTFLWRYAGSPEPASTENPFTDVPAGSWFEKPVLWAVEMGITNGMSDDTFGPGLTCNRAQVVTFLWRMMKQPKPTLAEHPFSDVPADIWYEKPVLWALENGITTGKTPTTFAPTGECQRAQVVTFLHRTALLAPVTYELSAAYDASQGTVTLSHTEAVPGETITVTVVPNEGYQVESVNCLGAELTPVSDTAYTFVMPEQDVFLEVSFTELPAEPGTTKYPITLKDNGYGTVQYKDVTEAAPGESFFFYAIPNEGYVFTELKVFNPDNSIDVSKIQLFEHEDNLWELIMIDKPLMLTCVFTPAN